MRTTTEFVKFKKNCYKSGNTDEAIAKTEKLGFKSKYEVIHPFIKDKTLPIFLPICSNGVRDWYNIWLMHMIKET